MAMFCYEKEERVMSHEDLEFLHKAGVDVWFLLTGERTQIDLISSEVKEFLMLWDSIELSKRKTLMALVRNFAETFPIK